VLKAVDLLCGCISIVADKMEDVKEDAEAAAKKIKNKF
jgi:hypothetical protein